MTINMWLISQCILMFIGGQLLHLFLIKLPAVKKRCLAGNIEFSFVEYWKEDKYLVIATNVFGAMIILGLNEIIAWKPLVLQYIKWFFAFVGAFGSSVILSKFSIFEKKLQAIVDQKTNQLSDIKGGTEDTNINVNTKP